MDVLGFQQWTPMQEDYLRETSPYTMLLSETGSGKTLAFLVHLLKFHHLREKSGILVLSPTRELAMQLHEVLQSLRSGLRSVLCYGGHSFKDEQDQLQAHPEIVIATPGRMLDHLRRKSPGLEAFDQLVLDEYDKILELGFYDQLEDILGYMNGFEQIQLVSATEIERLPDALKTYSFVRKDYRESKEEASREISWIRCPDQDKFRELLNLLWMYQGKPVMVFCTHREAVDRISEHLWEAGKSHAAFHGGLEQKVREESIIRFNEGIADCLLSTDLASRGLDLEEVACVIHYQLPGNEKDYIHRNGRTGRMGKEGKVHVLLTAEDQLPEYMESIEELKLDPGQESGCFETPKLDLLYLDLGRKDKIRKMDIVGALTGSIGVPNAAIKKILIRDRYSYLVVDRDGFGPYRKSCQKMQIKKKNCRLRSCR